MYAHQNVDSIETSPWKDDMETALCNRTATIEDIAQLNHLMRQSKGWWGYDQAFLDNFMEKMGITSAYIEQSPTFLAVQDSQVVGFYSFTKTDGQFELDNFFIHPDVISTGKGRKMWNLCVAKLGNYGARDFILWSDPNAENFYVKMGCVKVGERQSPLMPNRFPPIMKYIL